MTTFDHSPRTLAELRRSRGVTQVELAERLGWTQPQVARFERGPNPQWGTLQTYAAALSMTLVLGAITHDDNSYQRLVIGHRRPPRRQE